MTRHSCGNRQAYHRPHPCFFRGANPSETLSCLRSEVVAAVFLQTSSSGMVTAFNDMWDAHSDFVAMTGWKEYVSCSRYDITITRTFSRKCSFLRHVVCAAGCSARHRLWSAYVLLIQETVSRTLPTIHWWRLHSMVCLLRCNQIMQCCLGGAK